MSTADFYAIKGRLQDAERYTRELEDEFKQFHGMLINTFWEKVEACDRLIDEDDPEWSREAKRAKTFWVAAILEVNRVYLEVKGLDK